MNRKQRRARWKVERSAAGTPKREEVGATDAAHERLTAANAGQKTIGLCMIVKNESKIILQCLESVRPLVDYVLVEDTGSTDGTQAIIREWLERVGLPGEVFDEPWRDFAYNRSVALTALRRKTNIDYALMIDADDRIEYDVDFDVAQFKAGLTAQLYSVPVRIRNVLFNRAQLCSNRMPFLYRGVLHEFLDTFDGQMSWKRPATLTSAVASGFQVIAGTEGGRGEGPDKFRKDAELLEEALKTEKDPFLRSRYTYYLAASYGDCGEKEKALSNYLKRTKQGHWDQEIFQSFYNAAELQAKLGYAVDETLATYAKASDVCPSRAEALHGASHLCRLNNRFAEGYELAKRGLLIARPSNGLFIQPWIYDYGLLDEFAVNAYWIGHYDDCLATCERLLREGKIPAQMRDRIEQNARLSREKLSQRVDTKLYPPASQMPRSSYGRDTRAPKKTIGLCMIAKNEAKVILQCLESVRSLVDYVLIEDDTKSTDGTATIVREWLDRSKIPGTVLTVPWRDFGYNRSHALASLRKHQDIDYALIIDADDLLVFEPGFDVTAFKQGLSRDMYSIPIRQAGFRYERPQMCSNHREFQYCGVAHEFLKEPPGDVSSGTVAGFYIESRREGASQDDPDKYRKHVQMFQQALASEQDAFLRSRYTFYLARSYRDAGEPENALPYFMKRAELGYWTEEVFMSLYAAGQIQEQMGKPLEEVLATYLHASDAAPNRAEALHAASRLCRRNSKFAEGYEYARHGLTIPLPASGLFVEPWIYDYGLLDEFAVNAYWVGRYDDCLVACEQLLQQGKIPTEMRGRVEQNARFASEKLLSPRVDAKKDTAKTAFARGSQEGESAAAVVQFPTKKIGLCMIVKNESHVIVRCLESVRPLIDYVLIEDTGSTDGTQAIIRKWLDQQRLPGEVFDEPWRDFAHNRSVALARLRERKDVDYALVIDADDLLVIEAGFDVAAFKKGLSDDEYRVEIRNGPIRYQRSQICSNRREYRYRGVLHEFLQSPPGTVSSGTAIGFHMISNRQGARSQDPDQNINDAKILENALSTETDPFLRARYVFYIARSYQYAGKKEKALDYYLNRAELGYWSEEIFCSLYSAAELLKEMGRPFDEVVAMYQRASDTTPSRAEALHAASWFCRDNKKYAEGFEYARRGLKIPLPADGLFVQAWVYDYGLLDELAVNAYWIGRYAKCVDACDRLLGEGKLPTEHRDRVLKNRQFAIEHLPNIPIENIPISDLLMGGENGCSGTSFAEATGDLLRLSTPVARSPHVEFLKDYLNFGDEIFRPERFALTRYWRNALRCIEMQGQYFGATTIDGVVERAKRFVRMLAGERFTSSSIHETQEGVPVKVRRIKFSDCYEIVDGSHRLAIAVLRGAERYPCTVVPCEALPTPMQKMVMDSSWTEGNRILYQPIDLPEFRGWPTVRGCTDRLEMMKTFVEQHNVPPGSYLDIGCSYGWFVHQMSKQGYDAFGVDRDAAAVAVGKLVYGVDPSAVTVDDVVKYLSRATRRYNVVSCFSILHHYVLGKGSISPIEFIRLVDAVTETVLFLDTGEPHEGWFKNTLKEWTPEFIADWLRQHTSFASIEILGTDQDGKGQYSGQYGRHIFACYRAGLSPIRSGLTVGGEFRKGASLTISASPAAVLSEDNNTSRSASLDDQQKKLSDQTLSARKRIGIIVPYRHREQHLSKFVPHLISYFHRDTIGQSLAATIIITEQGDDLPFNRGGLLNAGFLAIADAVDYICFHDIDYLPMWADYSYAASPTRIIWWGMHSRPIRVNNPTARTEAPKIGFGAVTLFANDQFRRVNGYCNRFFGWGFEDKDLAARCRLHSLTIVQRDGTFIPLDHDNAGFLDDGSKSPVWLKNEQRYAENQREYESYGTSRDGLSTFAAHTSAVERVQAAGLDDSEKAEVMHLIVNFGELRSVRRASTTVDLLKKAPIISIDDYLRLPIGQ